MVNFWRWNDLQSSSYQLPAQLVVPSKPFFSPRSVLGRAEWVSHSVPNLKITTAGFFFRENLQETMMKPWFSPLNIIYRYYKHHYIMYHREPGNSKVSLFFLLQQFLGEYGRFGYDTKMSIKHRHQRVWYSHLDNVTMSQFGDAHGTLILVKQCFNSGHGTQQHSKPTMATMAAEHHPFSSRQKSRLIGISACKIARANTQNSLHIRKFESAWKIWKHLNIMDLTPSRKKNIGKSPILLDFDMLIGYVAVKEGRLSNPYDWFPRGYRFVVAQLRIIPLVSAMQDFDRMILWDRINWHGFGKSTIIWNICRWFS